MSKIMNDVGFAMEAVDAALVQKEKIRLFVLGMKIASGMDFEAIESVIDNLDHNLWWISDYVRKQMNEE